MTSLVHPTGILKRPPPPAAVLGWAISLLVHALAAAWLLHAWLPRPANTDTGPAKRTEVRLVPIAPPASRPAAVASETSARVRPTPASAPAAKGRTLPGRPPRLTVASPAPSATSHEPEPDAPRVTDTGAGASAPTVDLAAARATARLVARESGKGLVALPGRKPVVDANAEHQVVDRLERARRVDCQTARAGSTNLLANVVLLAVDLAKNAVDDSGCKW